MKSIKKRDGFIGEDAIVLPKKVVQQCESTPFVNSLFVTDIGYYPRAQFHYRERRNGIDQHILIYCIDGAGVTIVDGRKYVIKATNFLIVPAGKQHIYWSDNNLPWTIFWVHFKGSNANVLCDILYGKMLENKNSILPDDKINGLFYRIFKNLQDGYSYQNMLQSTIMLHNYLSFFAFPDSLPQKDKEEKDDMIENAIKYLKDNIHRALTLNEIAFQSNYSPTHFSSKFKKITGYSPIEYFNHLKLQKACHLLRFSKLRISEVADAIGVEDPYYFSRLFSSHLGISPKEFRSSKQMDNASTNNS